MSNRTATAIKSYLEGLSLAIPIDAVEVPISRQPPYLLVQDLIAGSPLDGHGDFGDPAADESVAELAQVDYVFPSPDGTGRPGEDPAIVDRIALALRGAYLSTAPYHVYGVQVDSIGPRVPLGDLRGQISITIRIRRALRRL